MGWGNFPLGGYSQPGSWDAVPWLASLTSTLRRSCAHGQPLPVPFQHPHLIPRGTGFNLQIHPTGNTSSLQTHSA